jgi:hypothetical protein
VGKDIQGTGYTGYRIMGAGYRMQDTRCTIQDAGYRIQDSRIGTP